MVFWHTITLSIEKGGRGRGRGSYQTEASRGRFGARGVGGDYNRPRGTGYQQRGSQGF